ncbi:MAG: hypothetical protein ACOC4C_03975 [Fibrobacterota bacterium]
MAKKAAFFLIVLLHLAGCREENVQNSSQQTTAQTGEDVSAQTDSARRQDYDSLIYALAALEGEIMRHPTDTNLRKRFLKLSFDTLKGGFMVVGMGLTKPDSSTTDALLAQKASKKTSLRWALYAKAWHTNHMIAFGTPISGDIAYHQSLLTTVRDDTTFQLTFVPLGSIRIKAD